MNTSSKWQQFIKQQLRLHQLYLDRNDVSGRDALDALAKRRRSAPHQR